MDVACTLNQVIKDNTLGWWGLMNAGSESGIHMNIGLT